MYPDGVINFQQDQSPVHKSQLLQGWLTDQNEVELLDLPPCGADLNPIKNVWMETKHVDDRKLA
jgi:transposase